ncbi:unnamed protein product [Caenorhabditis sp. 36 PRJEB53466]|nr:unnamed protein product [Caenorhabditis sp. 36 PRJEB53466]
MFHLKLNSTHLQKDIGDSGVSAGARLQQRRPSVLALLVLHNLHGARTDLVHHGQQDRLISAPGGHVHRRLVPLVTSFLLAVKAGKDQIVDKMIRKAPASTTSRKTAATPRTSPPCTLPSKLLS